MDNANKLKTTPEEFKKMLRKHNNKAASALKEHREALYASADLANTYKMAAGLDDNWKLSPQGDFIYSPKSDAS